MEMPEQRGRSLSASRLSNHSIRHSASPSPHGFANPPQQDYLPQPGQQGFLSGNYGSSGLDPNLSFDLQGQLHETSQPQSFPPQYVLSTNDFGDTALNPSAFDAGGEMTLDGKPSNLKLDTPNHHFSSPLLDPNNFGEVAAQQQFANKESHPFDSAFSLDQTLQDNMNNHPSINPAELMNSAPSPQNLMPTPPNMLPPDHLSPTQHSPASTKQRFSPHHSRQTSLEPASASFPKGQVPSDWTGTQFRTHRRAPSEHSDVSSSLAPSPYIAQQDAFDPAFDQNPSPMLNAQQDPQLYQDALGIEAFSLSDPQQHPQHPGSRHVSPGHSPYMSPRMNPQQGFNVSPDQPFVLPSNDFQNHLGGGGAGPEGFTGNPAAFAQPVMRHEASDMGQADSMAPPEITLDLAPPSKHSQFGQPMGPGMSQNDFDALSPPARSMWTLEQRQRRGHGHGANEWMTVSRGRSRAKSDTYIPRPASPSSTSPTLTSSGGNSPISPLQEMQRHRSLSPFEGYPSYPSTRDPSPAGSTLSIPHKSRRSSTSSIPQNSRDYILELADPTRPAASGVARGERVQKHPATFQCTLCPKRFTRAYNLRSHLRTHTDERPFVCTVCGKAFARQHDRKRHEGLHSGEKKFVCRGDLVSVPGGTWGCGRKFARADALGRHFRSEAGRVCIKPLLDEEAMERHRINNEAALMANGNGGGAGGPLQPVPPPMMMTGGFALPAALLAQYPALQGISWDDNAAMGGDDGDLSGRSGGFDGGASSGGEGFFDDEDGVEYLNGEHQAHQHQHQHQQAAMNHHAMYEGQQQWDGS